MNNLFNLPFELLIQIIYYFPYDLENGFTILNKYEEYF